MARHTYFSFHYQRDVQRAAVVRNSWVTRDRTDAGFFENGLWERAKGSGAAGIRSLIGRGMSGTSVNCVCIGHETWGRYWVRYEILKAFVEGKGILGVQVHNIRNFRRETDPAGNNPFEYLGFQSERDGVRLKVKFKGEWGYSQDYPDLIPWGSVAYDLGGRDNHTFSTLFKVHSWDAGGAEELGGWIETAARQAGR
jgi:hypothetical protein